MSGRSMRAVYEGLAEALLAARPAAPYTEREHAAREGWEFAVEAVAAKLEALNPGFDKRRFLIAAGRIVGSVPTIEDGYLFVRYVKRYGRSRAVSLLSRYGAASLLGVPQDKLTAFLDEIRISLQERES